VAQADWITITNMASSADVAHTPTMAPSLEPKDGDFTYAFMSHVADVKFSGLCCAAVNFSPLADVHSHHAGGSIRGYMRKHTPVSGPALFAPMFFIASSSGAPDLDDNPSAYKLGLSEQAAAGSPYHITLAKGSLRDSGVKATTGDYLLRGTTSYTTARWFGLRLDVLFNPQGEIVLNVYEDTANNPVSPIWTRPAGFPDAYVDDGLGLLSGTLPLTGTLYVGFGQWSSQVGCCSAFDYLQISRQLNP